MQTTPKLAGKVAIVTGSGRGVGRAVVLKLAGEGARVVVNDLDAEPAEEAASAIRALGGEAVVCAGDVTAPDFGERLVSTALEKLGRLDIIVNNAGYIWNTTIQKHTDEQWYAMMDVHATAPFRILRAAAPYLRAAARQEQSDGQVVCRKVVNVSSISGVYGAATQLGYSAAKAAAIGITKTLAKEWGRYNVTVNCVALGHISTRLTEPLTAGPKAIRVKGHEHQVGLEPEALDLIHALTPLGRGGTPEDAAGAVYLFCIPESDFVSGQVLICSGGLIF
jgi:3-oxoacyl-[acyl-carrier protein] reductase